ncbi:thioesterase family protein [Cyanobium sp. Morenito 9A2]|uniref:acyl-CoA thioesterase n=1 Tax=Cyanobium sp. Morenito 9A2 TaxID=2823718 RepID=UPI0020CFCF78|nr:thioesterase family protein [Cyanobium sp. Morenito 9A2]
MFDNFFKDPPIPGHWLHQSRTVRFGDTDAAGVMHFHQLLRWCHEAYEQSLEAFGLSSAEIFPGPTWRTELPGGRANPAVALPIVHTRADFHRPMLAGDALAITLAPVVLEGGLFEVRYRFEAGGFEAANALTRHRAIEAATRQRCGLPEPIERWLKASSAAEAAGGNPQTPQGVS